MKHLTILLAVLSLSIACKKKCNCTIAYNPNETYIKGDLVLYHDTCWKAQTQGTGATPGPWLQGKNDVWKQCK
jgi:hypothetical protein